MDKQGVIIDIKFKMSSILARVLDIQDEGYPVRNMNLIIDINIYSDLIEDMKYLDKDKLISLKEQLEKDLEYVKEYKMDKMDEELVEEEI